MAPDEEPDELLRLWESAEEAAELNRKRALAEHARMGPERAAAIDEFLEDWKRETREEEKKKRRRKEEQQEQTECKLMDERELRQVLGECSNMFAPGWMTVDRCIRVCLPKQVDDDHHFFAECMRRWRFDILGNVARLLVNHNKMFYFGIAASINLDGRASNLKIGHARNFDAMHILAYGPSPVMGDFEDFLIKYSWMQSGELVAPRCLNQATGRGGQGTKKDAGYLYMTEKERTPDDCDVKFSPSRQRFLKNDDERAKIQLMLD